MDNANGMKDKFILCENCLLNFNLDINIPMLLPCGHSMCKKCLDNNFKRNAFVKCPNDNNNFFNDLNSYSINYSSLELIEKYSEDIQIKSKILININIK